MILDPVNSSTVFQVPAELKLAKLKLDFLKKQKQELMVY